MPQATRQLVQAEADPDSFLDPPSVMEDTSPGDPGTELEEFMVDADAEPGEDDMDDEPPDSPGTSTPLPPNIKEISSLASWSASSSKPGCGVAQLRLPSTTSFWQSDGPAPHYLNIHFFKVVEIVAMRIFLDFDQDESYTPKEIAFLAGMGEMDLQEWAVMHLVEPRGWINVDFDGVGAVEGSESEDSDDEVEEDEEEGEEGARRKKRLPALRAMLVQVKIVENHQNGKDTHLRGLQIFAKDKMNREKKISAAKIAAISGADSSKKKAKMIPDMDLGFPEVEL
ncbi:anaphase-promoting complex, subunit 10-domain-containing protein, partial [Phyllosticta citricarpa]